MEEEIELKIINMDAVFSESGDSKIHEHTDIDMSDSQHESNTPQVDDAKLSETIKVGKLSPEERKRWVLKYLEKKRRRNFESKV